MGMIVTRIDSGRLPPEIRGDLADADMGEVVVKPLANSDTELRRARMRRLFEEAQSRIVGDRGATTEEAVQRIRALR